MGLTVPEVASISGHIIASLRSVIVSHNNAIWAGSGFKLFQVWSVGITWLATEYIIYLPFPLRTSL